MLLSATVVALGACGPTGDRTAAIDSVAVIPAQSTIAAGGSIQLLSEADDVRGRAVGGASFEFRSSDPSVVSVSSTGRVTSEGAAGAARIEVRSGAAIGEAVIRVTPGRPERLEAPGGGGQIGEVGRPLPVPLAVTVRDTYGNAVPGVPVHVEAPGAVFPRGAATSGSDGRFTWTWVLGTAAGAQLCVAEAGSAAHVTFSAVGTPGQPDRMLKHGQARTATGEILSVVVLDAVGNPVSGERVRWTANAGAISPAVAATDASGVSRAVWIPAQDRHPAAAVTAVTAAPEHAGLRGVRFQVGMRRPANR